MTHNDQLLMDSKVHAQNNVDEWTTKINEDIQEYGNGIITRDMMLSILELRFQILELKSRFGITPITFLKKAKQYFDLKGKLSDMYGIDIPSYYPYSNPVTLKESMDAIVIDAVLSIEQRTIFWRKIIGDKNAPTKYKTDKMIREKKYLSKLLRSHEHLV